MSNQVNFLVKKNLNAIKKATLALKNRYDVKDYIPTKRDTEGLKDNDFVKRLSLIVSINNVEISLIIAFKRNFPDSFPKIYLHPKTPDKFKILPHVDNELFICTFDEVEAFPNNSMPRQVALETIEKALNILKNGLNGLKSEDYDEEFIAYWYLHNTNFSDKIVSIFTPDNDIKTLCLLKLDEKNTPFNYILSDYFIDALIFLRNINYKGEYKKLDSLYLPLTSFGCPPYPKNLNEIIKLLKIKDSISLSHLYKFLFSDKRPSFITFSLNINEEYILGVWKHSNDKRLYKKGKKRVIGVPGFRFKKVPQLKELMFNEGLNVIKKPNIVRLDKESLFKRTKGDLTINQHFKISMIGCGSIGSYLLDNLIKSGFNNYSLVDPDRLLSVNISRHICGYDDIKKDKVKALKSYYEKKYPYLNISINSNKIEAILSDDISFLNDNDLNIICIGHLPIELSLNQLFKKGFITKPLLFVWVEPYLVAGHACFFIPEKDGCFSCLFDESFYYKYSYLKDISFTKREAGCQSTYVPYGANDIQLFTNMLSRFIIDIHEEKYDSNTAYTWLGDLTKIKLDSSNINHMWEGKNSFSYYTDEITPKEDCEYCNL